MKFKTLSKHLVAQWALQLSVVVVGAVGVLAAIQASAQSWNYWLYNVTTGERMAPSYIQVEDKGGGKATFRMIGANLTVCYRQTLAASLTKTDATTIVAIVPGLPGCEEVRFVVKNDGAGGQREVRAGSD